MIQLIQKIYEQKLVKNDFIVIIIFYFKKNSDIITKDFNMQKLSLDSVMDFYFEFEYYLIININESYMNE